MLMQNYAQESWLDNVIELENQKVIAKGGSETCSHWADVTWRSSLSKRLELF